MSGAVTRAMHVPLPVGKFTAIAAEDIARPGLSAVENAGRLDRMFQAIVRDGGSFTGGDGVYSAQIGERTLFEFGDTNVQGTIGNWRWPSPIFRQTFVNHSLATMGDDGFRLHVPGFWDRFRGEEFLQPPAGHQEWYWPGAIQQTDAGVQMLLTRFTHEGAQGGREWGWRRLGTDVATLDPETLALRDLTRMNEDTTTSWGAAMLRDGDDQYVYGAATQPDGHKLLTIARGSAHDLRVPWTFTDASGTATSDATRAARLPVEVANQFSVLHNRDGGVDIIAQESFAPHLTYTHGSTPVGPFDTADATRIDLPHVDSPQYIYNTLIHPEFGDEHRLVASVNHNRIGGTTFHAGDYTPRFMSVPRPDRLGLAGEEQPLRFGA